MATRYISSPGVQISETDRTLLVNTELGTTVFMTGFAAQGPTDEVTQIGSVSEFESIFGLPTNAQERYLYHSARQVLTQSPARLLVTRIPYGPGEGEGYASSYSALVYPVSATLNGSGTKNNWIASSTYTSSEVAILNYVNAFNQIITGGGGSLGTSYLQSVTTPETSAAYIDNINNIVRNYPTITLFTSAAGAGINKIASVSSFYITTVTYEEADSFQILPPTSVILTDAQYEYIVSGGVDWEDRYSVAEYNSYSQIGAGGIVVLNPSKVAVNSLYEGYYLAVADNSNNGPATDFDAVVGIKAANSNNGFKQFYTDIPSSRLSFALSADYRSPKNSISESIERLPNGFDFSQTTYNDCLTFALYKIRTSIYGDSVSLDYKIDTPIVGSLYANKTQNNPLGGSPISFSLDKVSELTRGQIKVYVNPYISSKGTWVTESGTPAKTVRVASTAKNLYSHGVFVSSTNDTLNDVGNLPAKVNRNLTRLRDLDVDIDIAVEAGLGTVWAGARNNPRSKIASSQYYFDENYPMSTAALSALQDPYSGGTAYVEGVENLRDAYLSIANLFYEAAEAQERRDHMFILDPLRYIFVNGPNTKVSTKLGYDFSKEVYNALKNLHGSIPSQYGASYANWIRNNDTASDQLVWLPSSGYVAADIAFSSAVSFPWSAPAGFTRGVLRNVIDLAINPTQKQRDYLYKINQNPIAFFPGDGYVIFGQKTLFNQPSAFDRINVRRLFLTLEKATKRLLKYFIFEPNSFSTRVRLTNALSPIFEQAKNNDGVYDYRIICDERNNTPDVIDNNELKVAIYIQPTRTAEFILAEFIGTRTGVNLNELVP